ncbi:MAG TPA: glycosyltransferase family 2 protein [Mycobacteriales bacterium]|nr:glycosyltransferase family 2 protein [Mycobacteriales bacterium]
MAPPPLRGRQRVHRALHEAPDTAQVTDAARADFLSQYPDQALPPLVVVIAAYNEAANIAEVVDEIPDRIGGLDTATLVIDDGSDDETAAIAEKHGALVCRLPVNRGHGVALRLGYRIAREGEAAYVATLDGDGQWDPADLPAMVEVLTADRADFVIGSRQLGSTRDSDRFRNAGVRFFAWLISRLTRTRLTDTSSGLRAMRAELTGAVRQVQPQYQTSELLIGAVFAGYRVAEVPTVMRPRLSGESKKGHNLLYGFRYASVIMSTWRRERRNPARAGRPGQPVR